MQENLIEKWRQWIKEAVGPNSGVKWESLIINKRKPHTYRASTMLPDGNRVCLHRFDVCEVHESFVHPHRWPAEFFVLQGKYLEQIWYTQQKPLVDHPYMKPVSESICVPGSWHKIENAWTWHRITPLTTHVWTVMINGRPFDNPLDDVLTMDKDLDRMTIQELDDHLSWVGLLL